MEILEHLAPVAERYDGFVLDLWGVVHDGRTPYPGVLDCLERLRAAEKRVVFLTNAPRRAWFVAGLLDGMGVGRHLYDGIISSGEVTWRWLKEGTHPFFAALPGRRPPRVCCGTRQLPSVPCPSPSGPPRPVMPRPRRTRRRSPCARPSRNSSPSSPCSWA